MNKNMERRRARMEAQRNGKPAPEVIEEKNDEEVEALEDKIEDMEEKLEDLKEDLEEAKED